MLEVKALREIAIGDLDLLPRPISYVPTMGALHAGHQELIQEAKHFSAHTLVSVFVNPLQFESPEDLEKYPRTRESDFAAASEAGAEYIWFPQYNDLYPSEPQLVSAGDIGRGYEGKSRPGHFDGMLTVVKRYFDLVKPEYAIFGEKDWQQLTLIRNMVRDHKLPVKIISVPTVREQSGVAMSSRNSRLSFEGMEAANVIHQALIQASALGSTTEREARLREVLSSEKKFAIDYADEIVSDRFSRPEQYEDGDRLIVACWIEGVRLIDNIAINHSIDASQQGQEISLNSAKGLKL